MIHRGVLTRAGICVGLAALTLAVFWPVGGHGFVNYDDDVYVTANPAVERGLDAASLRWAWTSFHAANWHPLTWMSHMLDVELWGLDPAGHHRSSMLLHAAAAIVLFLALASATGADWPSAGVAALFAVHPLHVQSVAWVAERKDVLSALLWFLATWAYVAWVRRPAAWRYALLLAAFALGLTAKPVLVTFPFTLLLLDVWPLERRPRLLEKLPLFALAAASMAITFVAQRAGEAVLALAGRPLSARLANAVVAYAVYLWKTIWPVELAVFYPFPEHGPVTWKIFLAVVVLVALSALAWHARRHRPWLLVGWLFYLGTLVPMIGVVQVGKQAMADRYTYVPLVGIFLALLWSLARLTGRRRAVAAAAVGLAVAALAVTARREVGHWRDSETLFARALEVTSDNAVAHANLAAVMSADGRTDRAIEHYRRAIEIDPALVGVRVALARALGASGRPDEAIEHCERALALRPDDAGIENGCGVVLFDQDRVEEALARFERAVALAPDYAGAYRNLGLALERLGRLDEARERFAVAVRLDPDDAVSHFGLGTLLGRQGRWAEAAESLSRAVALRPDHAEAHYNLGLVLRLLGRDERARQEIETAARLGYRPAAE